MRSGWPPSNPDVPGPDTVRWVAGHGFLLLGRHLHDVPGLRGCFWINDVRHEITCGLQLVAPVPENVGSNPHNPERNSNDKDHRAAKREVHIKTV